MVNTQPQTINGSPVVAQYPGRGTGDTIYRTANGSVWRSLYPCEMGRAPLTGEIRSTLITPRPESR